MDTQDTRADAEIERALNAAANQVLAIVAPATSRLVQAAVTVAEDDTASTDGVHIWLPPAFEGVDVTQDAPVAIGLLAHELGHFLQPLEEVQQVEQETGAPHWTAAAPVLRRSRKCRCGAAHPPGHGRLTTAGLTSRHCSLIFVSGQRLSSGWAFFVGRGCERGQL